MSNLELLDLPDEIICNVLSNINDARTIKQIFATGNRRLIGLFLDCANLTVIRSRMETITPNLAKNFFDVVRINPTVIVNNIEDLRIIASLPRLKMVTLSISMVNSWERFIDIIKEFISHYCQGQYNLTDILGNNIQGQNNRNMNECHIWIKARLKDTDYQLVFSDVYGDFVFVGYDDINKSTIKIAVPLLIDFIHFYRRYTQMLSFNSHNLDDYTHFEFAHPEAINVANLIDVLLNIDELHIYYTYYLQNKFSIIFNLLINKLVVISSRPRGRHKRDTPINTSIINNLRWSNILTDFNMPININDIDLLMNKYPNLHKVTLYHQNENKIELLDLLRDYPQLENIRLLTKRALSLPAPFNVIRL